MNAVLEKEHDEFVEPEYTMPVRNPEEFMEVFILPDRYQEAVKELNKLLKRARRAGVEGVEWRDTGEKRIVKKKFRDEETGETWEEELVHHVFEVRGTAPVYKGWDFVARVEFLTVPTEYAYDDKGSQTGVIKHAHKVQLLHMVPRHDGVVLQDRFRETDTTCEHCNKKRGRKDVYIVSNAETGEQKQIGRDCLRDFLGIDTPEKVARRFEFWGEIHDMTERGREAKRLYGFLQIAAASVQDRGYVSKAASQIGAEFGKGTTSTLEDVYSILYPNLKDADSVRRSKEMIELSKEEKSHDLVKATLAYFAELAPYGDYQSNVKKLLEIPVILDRKHEGLIVSAIQAYIRHAGLELEKKIKFEKAKKSEFVGEVGQRIELELTLESYRSIGQNRFSYSGGETMLYLFMDNEGNKFKWITSTGANWGREEKKKVKATIKKHETYKEIKSTMITRVKIID